jgi:hypothetical protein
VPICYVFFGEIKSKVDLIDRNFDARMNPYACTYSVKYISAKFFFDYLEFIQRKKHKWRFKQ